MSNFINNNNSVHIVQELLTIYDKVMVLKLYVDSNDQNLFYNYLNSALDHNNKVFHQSQHIDAGFDFFGPGWQDRSPVNKLDHKICCSAKMFTDTGKSFNTGYYMHPRSSLSKTKLRLANSTGIIDAGYRGHLIGMFDVVNVEQANEDRMFVNDDIQYNNTEADYWGKKFDRYVQICAPGLCPIVVEIVQSLDELGSETERGSGGFGSTGR